MNSMFWDADAFNQPLGDWRVDEVTDMGFMFHGASSFNQDIGAWDTSGVTTMHVMFFSASAFNQDLSGWAVHSVTDMSAMFQYASAFDQDLGWCVDDGVFDPNGEGYTMQDAFPFTQCESTSCGVTQGNCPTNSRRDRRLTFDSDSGSPPWHRLWEKTWHHYCVTYAAVPKEKGRPRNVTFYVDGVAEDTWKATVNTSLGSPLYIGADVQAPKR